MLNGRPLILVLLFCLMIKTALAQRTIFYQEDRMDVRMAMDLFRNGKFAASIPAFEAIGNTHPKGSALAIESAFYSALAAYELFNEDAGFRLRAFVYDYPEDYRAGLAAFYLGNLYYRQRNYQDAIFWYEKTDRNLLSKEQRKEFKFKNGYALFVKDKIPEAKVLFSEVKDIDGIYAAPATYYFAHIEYLEGNYESALTGFRKFTGKSVFSSLVPYYISNILFLQNKYRETIEYALPVLDSMKVEKSGEVHALIAESYYRLQDYVKALPHIENAIQNGVKPERNRLFQLAYCQYRANRFQDAIGNYQKVIRTSDTLTQISYYQLADCYIKTGDRKNARNCYESAARDAYDKQITENALFNYALLSYELAYNPYHEAIDAFRRYIEEYPESPRLEEAYKLLVNVYLNTRNYKEALVSIEKIKRRNAALDQAYQRICFNRGVELFNDRELAEAVKMFNKSIAVKSDRKLTAESRFWKAECFYRQNDYEKAFELYNDYLSAPGARSTKGFISAYYNMGYCRYRQKNYTEAINWFRKIENSSNQTEAPDLYFDAMQRLGDCYFVARDYGQAGLYYGKAVDLNPASGDYPMYQLAMTLGLNGKSEEKITYLQSLLQKHPDSELSDDAWFEIGNAHLIKNRNEQALEAFSKVTKNYPSGSLARKAALKTGLVYYNNDRFKEALEAYRFVFSRYPKTEEATAALNGMKNIYVETGEVNAFEEFVKSQPGLKLSPSELDSTTYAAAEKKYYREDFKGALNDLLKYIERFPNGFFILNARYQLADCAVQENNPSLALENYEAIISQPGTKYFEGALLRGAQQAFRQADFNRALEWSGKLEQAAGQPADVLEARKIAYRSAFELKDYVLAKEYAHRLINGHSCPDDLKVNASLVIAKCDLQMGNLGVARSGLQSIAQKSQSETGAEAQYLLAETWFLEKNYEQTEKTIYELIDRVPSYDFWLAKSFLLLASNLEAQGDAFQAKETLQSIIEKCEIPELVKLAGERLAAIREREKRAEEQWKETETLIRFDTNSINDNRLFENEIPE